MNHHAFTHAIAHQLQIPSHILLNQYLTTKDLLQYLHLLVKWLSVTISRVLV